jgi:Kef-type K+ transport system membrane component KefB
MPTITSELAYIALVFGLMVVPRALQRFAIPAPLTCFAFGMAATIALRLPSQDDTLALLATLGISSLFLFAGLEVDLSGLRREMVALLVHLGLRCLLLAAAAWLAVRWLDMTGQAALLVALAVLTPSTGFILESLARLGLDQEERFWVTSKAVAGELLALVIMFVTLQAGSAERLAWSTAALVAMLFILPLLFIALVRYVVPYAIGSEFSLLVMVGLLAAYLTKQLGVYYLVGAFAAGMVARLLQARAPHLASDRNLQALKLFATFFVPFYFFYRGMNVPGGALQWQALAAGLALSAVVMPLRVGFVWAQRRLVVREDSRSSLRVAIALTPTLIFTLVLAAILRERFGLPDIWYGALLVYAATTTLLPSLTVAKPFDLDATDLSVSPSPTPPAKPSETQDDADDRRLSA